MIYHIEKCYKNNLVASFYCDIQSPETHLTGLIAGYDNDSMIIKHISPDGYYDGFVIIQQRDLFRIDFDGMYEKRITKLYHVKHQNHPDLYLNDGLYEAMFKFAKGFGHIVSIEVGDSVLTGVIVDYTDSFLHLKLLDNYGRDDGESIVARLEIVSMSVDTSTEHNIQLCLCAE